MNGSPPSGRPRAHPAPHAGLGTGLGLWLVRHAEVHEDWQGRAYGDLDVPLSASGLERTHRMRAGFGRLSPSGVWTSPLQRARTAGAVIAEEAGVELRVEADLREIHRGTWQGRGVRELHEDDPESVRAFYADPWSWCGHGGENDEKVCTRAWRVVEGAIDTLSSTAAAPIGSTGPLVFTTHYNVIRTLVASALAIDPARSFALRVDPGRAVLLVDAPGGWQLHRSNAHGDGLHPEAPA